MQFFYDSGNITYDVSGLSAKASCGASAIRGRRV